MERRPFLKGSGDDSGASALEFALVVPFLIMLLVGMLEFGFIFQAQLAVTHAAREGARMAAVNKWDASVVEARAFPLKIADGLSVVPSNPDPDSVKVVVSYQWKWLIIPSSPVSGLFHLNAPLLTSSATMRKE